MASGVETLFLEALPVFVIAAVVEIFVTRVWELPYTIALLLAGLAMSVLGVITELLTIDIRLSHNIIFLVLLLPLLFEGGATTDLAKSSPNRDGWAGTGSLCIKSTSLNLWLSFPFTSDHPYCSFNCNLASFLRVRPGRDGVALFVRRQW